MPSYVLEATHLSRTAKWTALKNQILIFPPSPVNFFLFFPFLLILNFKISQGIG